MSVRSIGLLSLWGDSAVRRHLAGVGLAAPALVVRADDGRLAVRADRPVRLQRPPAVLAGLAQTAVAGRADQVVLLDLAPALLAGQVGDLRDPRLGGRHLDLALADVLEVLGRPQDQVDDRADVGEQRERGRARDQHGVGDPPLGVDAGPVDERQPDDPEEQAQQVDREIDTVVGDPEIAEHCGHVRRVYGVSYRTIRPNRYPRPTKTRITTATTSAT